MLIGFLVTNSCRSMTLPQLRDAIQAVDSSLSLEQLRGLATLFPLTSNERAALERVTDPAALHGPERFYYETLSVPAIDGRLNGAILQRTLPLELKDIRRNVAILSAACTFCISRSSELTLWAGAELRTSVRFAKLLKRIYKLGLTLNRNSYLARDSVGFSLTSLPKLSETSTNRGRLRSGGVR